MRKGRAKRHRGGEPLARALRACGRVVLWGALALIVGKGLAATIAPAEGEVTRIEGGGSEELVAATAERFARLYLEHPEPEVLDPYLAAGAKIGAGRPPSARGAQVAQTSVLRSTEVGDGRVVVTVSCELRDSRTLYLAVPIVRFRAGEAAVLGAPSIVAVPAVAGADPERPRPLAGPEGEAIRSLVAKFLPAYLSSAETSDLSYLLAPGASVVPLGGSLELDSLGSVRALGPDEGPRREVLATARVREPLGGATYELAYRLEAIERAGRWYVAALEGAVA